MPLPTGYAPPRHDDLLDELVCQIARLQRIERAAHGFVRHVEARRTAGWDKVPRRRTQHGEVGFEQLVEALESVPEVKS